MLLMVVGYPTILALHLFGAINLLEWPWWALVLLALPGPALALPELVLELLAYILLMLGTALEKLKVVFQRIRPLREARKTESSPLCSLGRDWIDQRLLQEKRTG